MDSATKTAQDMWARQGISPANVDYAQWEQRRTWQKVWSSTK